MNIHADKAQENISQSVAQTVSQTKSSADSTFQFVDNRPEAIQVRKLQELANNYSTQKQNPIQKKENNTGLPDNLKSGIENLSGYSMDDVKVHYNSDKPAQLQAHAYAQGTDIHLASGQEKHLPHEAWHVVQQKQGRVKPTVQMKGKININDDAGLEKEADVMGAKALQLLKTDSLNQHAIRDDINMHRASTLLSIQYVENTESNKTSKQQLIVENNQKANGLQLTKSAFLSILKERVKEIANQELEKIGQTSESCPYIDFWFQYYSHLSAVQIQRGMKLYAPSTASAKNANDFILKIVKRVQQGLQKQLSSGAIDPVQSDNASGLTDNQTSIVALNPPNKSVIGEVTQLGSKKNKVKKLEVDITRPGFRGSVDTMRKDAQHLFPAETIHMAHRLSWQSIRDTLATNNQSKIKTMVENLTIPQRNFGDPKSGGVKKGDLGYYNVIAELFKKTSDLNTLATALNSSPYNLRPGDGPTNSGIGGRPDAHFDETLPGEPMTPQSSSLLPANTDESSDFMTMSSFAAWESNFYVDYVTPAITSVKRLF